MRRSASLLLPVACAVAGFGWAAPSQATPAVAPSAASAQSELATLELSVEFSGVSRAEPLAAKTAAWFAGTSRHFSSRESDTVDTEEWLANPAGGLRILVRETAPGRLHLWFLLQKGATRKYLIREQVLPSGLDEIGLENLAQIIFSSALALVEGREETSPELLAQELPRRARVRPEQEQEQKHRDGALPRAASSVSPPGERASSQDRGSRLSAAAGYELRVSGPEGIFHGPLLALGARQKADGWTRALAVSVTLLVPGGFEETDYAVKTKGYSARLEAVATRSGSSALLPEVLFGLGVDWLSLSPESLSSPRFVASAERRSLRPFVSMGAGLSFRLGALRLSTQLEGVVHLSRTHYDVDEGGVRREALTAWPLQPASRVALRW